MQSLKNIIGQQYNYYYNDTAILQEVLLRGNISISLFVFYQCQLYQRVDIDSLKS